MIETTKTLQNFVQEKLPKVSWKGAEAVFQMAEEGATVPFMARYRKEKTGNLDEVVLRDLLAVRDEYNEVLKRREFVIGEIKEQGNLTPVLQKRLQMAWSVVEIEEIYRPFKRKKKTKATLAREAGLEPLAQWIWDLGRGADAGGQTLEVKAKEFVNPAAKMVTYEEVLRGAQHIIVEKVANDPDLRSQVREVYNKAGELASKPGKKVKAKSKFENYFEHKEKITSLLEKKNSHRYLAMRRGWKEGELTLSMESPQDEDLLAAFNSFVFEKGSEVVKKWLHMAAKTALTVHVLPSITNELHKNLKAQSDEFAIDVFASNLKKLLLASPFGSRCVLGVDPGLRTGCKIALVDPKGQFISHTVLKIQGEKASEHGKKLFAEVLKQIGIDAIAVGNGTGGREAEVFIRKILKDMEKNIPVILVNEAGASVYSASDVAREEFPDLDITIRGAVSIARRLQDPLAELVKIDPKSIGVGQYQHDIGASRLKDRLNFVVEDCVNLVGVDLNTASEHLLQKVSGIGPTIAKNIVKYRGEKGLFTSRSQLTDIPHYSSKTFEQSAGFLRIQGGDSILDSTGIHPERYSAVKDMAKEVQVSLGDLVGKGSKEILKLREKWAKLIGEYTFDDIVNELQKPGRDPRDTFKVFQFRDDIFAVADLKPEMICNGVVSNVTNFGAFVDIGVHQDGLVHISQMGHQFVQDTQKVLSPGDQVQVKVLSVDVEKKQISLSMKIGEAPQAARAPRKKGARAGGKNPARGKGAGKGSGKGRRPSSAGARSGKGRSNGPRKPRGPINNPFGGLGDLLKK